MSLLIQADTGRSRHTNRRRRIAQAVRRVVAAEALTQAQALAPAPITPGLFGAVDVTAFGVSFSTEHSHHTYQAYIQHLAAHTFKWEDRPALRSDMRFQLHTAVLDFMGAVPAPGAF